MNGAVVRVNGCRITITRRLVLLLTIRICVSTSGWWSQATSSAGSRVFRKNVLRLVDPAFFTRQNTRSPGRSRTKCRSLIDGSGDSELEIFLMDASSEVFLLEQCSNKSDLRCLNTEIKLSGSFPLDS